MRLMFSRLHMLTIAAWVVMLIGCACAETRCDKVLPQNPDDPGARLVARLYEMRRGSGRSVPDTLDLQDNALLAINAITRDYDPAVENRAWFAIYFDRRPMIMRHHLLSEFDLVGKFAECITLMRLMTGSSYNKEIDCKIWQLIDAHTKDDGLIYYDLTSPTAEPIYTYSQARVLLARICRYELTRNLGEKAKIERTIDAMLKRKMVRGFGFGPLLPASRWYELTGSAKALDLAKLDFDALQQGRVFADDGSFGGHFHNNTGMALGLLAYGLATHDTKLVNKMARVYEYARSKGTDYGYFPEAVEPCSWVMRISNEGCCTADMTCLAAALCRAGVGDYWDDLDRYLRNQLTEMQLKRTNFTDRVPSGNQVQIPVRSEQGETAIDDLTRFIGAFAGWADPNDFCGPAHYWIQQCCLGNGPRAIYAGWENIVTPSESGLRVNLLLNRSTREIDVDSYLPYEGKVVINVKQKMRVAVRIPGWTDITKINASINGRKAQVTVDGRYIDFPTLEKGAKIAISFPLTERTVSYHVVGAPWSHKYSIVDEDSGSGMQLPKSVNETPPDVVQKILEPVEYDAVFRGNTIVTIKPDGAICPMYQRSYMCGGSKTPLCYVKRCVPEELIPNWY